MRKGGRIFILLGVTLALVAAVLAIFAFQDTSDTEDVADAQVAMIDVIEAAQDIPVNHVITEDDITVVEVEEETVSPGTARSSGQVLGLASSGNIVSGQRVLMANLSTPGLSHIVSEGQRAMAVPIDRVNALGGMIRADDRVDVVQSTRLLLEHVLPTEPMEVIDSTSGYADDETLVLPPPGQSGERYPYPGEEGSRFLVRDTEEGNPVTRMVLQNIKVLRVVAGDITVGTDDAPMPEDDDTEQDDDGSDAESNDELDVDDPDRLPNTDMLILEVNAEQAELIKFLLDNGSQFQVVLRSPDDEEVAESAGMTYHQLVEDYGLPVPRTVRLP